MAIVLTGSQGYFTRMGKLIQMFDSSNVYVGDTDITGATPDHDAVQISVNEITAQFTSTDLDAIATLTSLREGIRGAAEGSKQLMVDIGRTLSITQIDRTEVLSEKTLTAAMFALVKDMIDAGTIYSPTDSVDANEFTVASTATADTTSHGGLGNEGNGVIAVSKVKPDGRNSEYIYLETLRFTCTADGQANGGGTERSETITCLGETAVLPMAYNWPQGSGINKTIAIGDAAQEEVETANLLHNSDFEEFTSNTPDNWIVLAGAASTDILEETSTVFRGSKALEFLGTGGSPLSSVAQTFDSTSGSSATLKPATVYAVCVWMRKSASLAAGNIEIRLLDGASAVISDDAGTANTISVAHGTITTSFAAYTGFFRTPSALNGDAATQKFNIRVSTALTSGQSVFIDDACMVEATELYTGGPWAAAFAGSTNFVKEDRFTLTPTQGQVGEFQTAFWRWFDLPSLGLQLPSNAAAAETIADSLIG